jgi:FkbM family methyltransferase
MIPFNSLTGSRYGLMISHTHDIYVGQSIQLYGEFSPGEMDLYRYLLTPGDVVVEVGANIGALTVPIAQCVGDEGRVFAFEPQRLTYQVLNGNLALNSLVNTVAFNVAVGATEGQTYVPPVNLTSMDNVGAVEMDMTKPPNSAVTALDSYQFPRLDLLKLDVEGMEYDCLQGATATIGRCRPLIVAEIDREAKKPLVLAWLRDHGYTLYAHSPPLYSEQNWRGIELNAWPGVVSFNVLAVPTEDDQPGKLTISTFGLQLLEPDAPQQEAA